MTLLLEFFQHCDTIAFVVVYETTVPIFESGKKCVSTVLLVGLLGTECDVIGQFFKIGGMQTVKTLAVKVIPFLKIFESFAFILNNDMRVIRRE